MNIVGEKDFLDLSRDRPNMFDLGFSDNSCHHLWRLSSMSLYIFFPSRSQYFFLITIFFLSLLFSGCDVSGQQLGTRDGESEPERGDHQLGRRSAVQLYSFRTVQNAVQRLLYRWISDQSFYTDHSHRSESRSASYLCFASGPSPLKHNLAAAGSGQSLN